MINFTKNIRISRTASLSAIGRRFDRDNKNFSNTSSSKSVSIAKKELSAQKKLIGQASKSKQKYKNHGQSKKDSEMKLKIKKQIDILRGSSNKSKKLVIGRRNQSTKIDQINHKEHQKQVKKQQLIINNWKDLQKSAPKVGYLYIDCRHHPKLQNSTKKITLSKDWVLITEPQEQVIISVSEYSQTLKKFQKLEKIQLFKQFLLIKTFRKWKMVMEFNQLNAKRNLIQKQIQKVYKNVYVQFNSLLDRIRMFKFIGSYKKHSVPLEDYHEYLFNCSSTMMQEIHDYIFVICIEIMFSPIKQLAKSLQNKSSSIQKYQDSYKRPFGEIQQKYQKRMLRIMNIKGERQFQIIKSVQFRSSFLQYFSVLKKCLYIFNESYIQWVRICLFQLISKIQGTLMSWEQQKQKFGQILNDIISHNCIKYTVYSPDFAEKQIGFIGYVCQINQSRLITFHANEEYLVSLFTQYSQYLIISLSFEKMIECYSRAYGFKERTELQLLAEVTKTNDTYNCNSILKTFPFQQEFTSRLKTAIAINFAEVLQVIDFYNLLVTNFFNCEEQIQNPSQIYQYLQSVKIKLLYLPKNVDVGLFALDFNQIHQYLTYQVIARQNELYVNVPAHFKELYANVNEIMNNSYVGIKNSMWTIDQLLNSFHHFQAYEEYRIYQMHEDLQKFKNYIEVISAKCLQYYQQCFMMFVHIKEMRDKLQIKTQIFTQRLPLKLKAFRNDIENLKEEIWQNLYKQQSNAICLCKQLNPIEEMLAKLVQSNIRLGLIKQKMDKLEVIGRLQLQYFIEQQLTVNTHSYIKMSNDIKYLVMFTQKYVDFQNKVHQIFPKSILDIRPDNLLETLRLNVSQIKQIYLLLIVYQTLLRDLLQKYQQWRQYLETVDQIAFLSSDELNGIRKLKQLSLHSKTFITFEECFSLNIHSVYQEIHQIKQKKIKVSELQLIFTDLNSLQIQQPFQIRKSRRRDSLKGKVRSGRSLDQGKNDIIKYQFQNFGNVYRSLQQFQYELKGLITSPYLSDYKLEIAVRIERLQKAIKILQQVSDARGEYNGIMEVQLFQDESQDHLEERKWLLSQQILTFFQSYRHQRQQVRQYWIKFANILSKRSLEELLIGNEDVENLMRSLSSKMKNLRECVQVLIRKKRQEIFMLNLVDNSTVLAVVQYPSYYFQLFYSVREVRKPQSQLQLVTIFDEILILHKADNEKDAPIQINSFELKISTQLRKLLAYHQNQHPIDNLLNYMALQLPLQIVYVLDQLYFAQKYLKNEKGSSQILRNLQGQIKLICRNGLRQQLDSSHINYALSLFDQLLASRIELRTRVQQNSLNEIWYKNILVFELYQNMLTLRNFNTQILSSFRLVDPTTLSLAFPFCEKALVKICNAMKFQESIIIEQVEIVSTIAARTMSLFYKITLTPSNIQNVLFACQQLYPLFVIGYLENLSRDLPFVFEQLNKIERINSLRTNISKDRRLLPSIFIYCEDNNSVELNQSLKLRFRTVNAVSPCPQIILSTKMLNHDYLIEKSIFFNIIYLLRAYVILLRQQKKYYISFKQLGLICDKIIRRLSLEPQINDSILVSILKDYFQAIEYPLDKLVNNFVIGKNRIQYEKSSIYETIQNIVLNSIKEVPSVQPSVSPIATKQYEVMKKSFNKYCDNLIQQKIDSVLIEKLYNLFQDSFNLQNRPIAVIGPHQSGKSLLFMLYRSYLKQTLGSSQLYWRTCNLQIYNSVLGTIINENEPIIEQFVNDNEDRSISWIVFEEFSFQQNYSLFQHIFSRIGQEIRLKNIPLSDSAISFCQLYNCRQKFLQNIRSLHSKYVAFEFESLKQVSPSYICSMSKIYLGSGTLSLFNIYHLKVNEFLKQIIDRSEDLFMKVLQDFTQISKLLFSLIQQILVKKIKNFEWALIVSQKCALQRTLNFFFSFFHHEARQKIQFLFMGEQHLLQLYKLITYSFYATFQNFVQKNSVTLLQKMIKSVHYMFNHEQNRDKFLGKICYFTSKQLNYLTFDQISSIEENTRDLSQNNIIQTIQMKLFHKKYLKNIVQMQNSIIILGNKQSGKTAMIKYFIDKYYSGQIIIKGDNDQKSLRELTKKIVGLGQSTQHLINFQTTLKKIDYCIFVEDVSCHSNFTKIQKYLFFMIKTGSLIDGLKINAAPYIASICERRSISEELHHKMWSSFILFFQTTKQYFDKVFSTFVCSRLQTNFKNKGKKNLTMTIFEKLTQKYLKIIRYCSENFKRGHKSWTYQFGIATLKSIIINFIDRYNYEQLLSEEELSSRMNIEILGRLLSRLQQLREVEKIQDRVSGLFDSGQLKAMNERSLRQNVLLNCNLEQQNLNSTRIKNVILTQSIRKFTPKLAIALRSANCVLINKINVPFNRSIASVCIQILKLPSRQLNYCESESKFLSQIERANEITLKKNSISYYYLGLQQIIGNPSVIEYIKNYLSKQPHQIQTKDSYYHQCKFIIQYSTSTHNIIANFLSAGILPYSYIMHFSEKGSEDIVEIANRLMQDRAQANSSGAINKQMQNAIKSTLKILDELKSFEPPRHLANYLFQNLNTSYLILTVINTYTQLLKKISNKRTALELSLSQLNYMFKEYKQRKAIFKQLQSEQSSLLSVIGLAKDDHRRRNLQYNSIKNENLKEAIQQNELEISKLQRQRDQLISSQKIWNNIYKNAHNAISRTEFAQIKYMFMTNYSIQRELFEAIAFVLGQQTDLHSLKKCFSDINIMARIKQLKVPELPQVRLKELESRIESISKRDKLSCGRNIVEWMKVGCRLGLYRLKRDSTLNSLQSRIKRYEQQNKQIRSKNKMDQMQKQLIELQKKITQKCSDLNIVHLKITSIGSELEQVKKQFEELIQFQTFCLQQLETLEESSKKMLNFCISESLNFTLVQMLTGQSRRKFRQLINTKLRKYFGGLVTKQQGDYFDLLREPAEKQSCNWLLKPKDYLSSSKKRLIGQINSFLLNQNIPLMVVDRRSVLIQDTIKNNVLILRVHGQSNQKIRNKQKNFQKYGFIILQVNSWEFSLQIRQNQFENHGKFRVFKQKNYRLLIPAHLPLVLIVKQYGPQELITNFKIIDLQYSVDDYYEIVWNTILKKRGETRQDIFLKLVKTEKSFMEIVYFLCKKTQAINLKSKDLIKILTQMIQKFNRQKSSTKTSSHFKNSAPILSQGDIKLCRVLSKIIQLMITLFPSQQHTSFFFRDLLNTSFDYIQMQGKTYHIQVQKIYKLLTEGFKDKFPFIYLYYIRIYSIEEGLATPIQSLNLTALPDPREQIVDALRDADRDPSNFFKYLPFKNIELEKVYSKLSKTRVKNQSEISKLIEGEKNLSFFNKLILKRALAPKCFQVQIGKIIRDFEDKITLKNKMFLRRYVVKQRLFCVCDAGFWVSKLKFTDEFKLVQLSEIVKADCNISRIETWAVFDDMQDSEQKSQTLKYLVNINCDKISIVLFSKQFLRQDFREQFKFLPFQHLLNIFEIKQLTKVSRSKYSHIFNKVIYFKTQLLRRKPFNQRISFSFLFQKIRQQIMNKQDYSIDQIILHFQWDFFLWDSSFQTNHLTLQYILSALDANSELINQFVADDKLQDRINAVISRSRFLHFDQTDICKLANQLRDSSSRLDAKSMNRNENDIFYLEFEYKKGNLMKQMQKIKRISQIHLGRIEITAELINILEMMLRSFEYSRFSDLLVKLINWRRLQLNRSVINIGLIKSEFNFYLLFQNSIYIYYQLPTIQIQNLSEDNTNRSNQQITSPMETKNFIQKEFSANQKQSPIKKGSRLQIPESDTHHRDSRKSIRSVGMMKNLINKGRRMSIFEISSQPQANQKTSQQFALQFFKNHLYLVESRLVGLKKLGIKEQKNLGVTTSKILDLPNKFSVRIIQLNNLVSSGKNESRFKISTQKNS